MSYLRVESCRLHNHSKFWTGHNFLLLRVSASEFTDCPAENSWRITEFLTKPCSGLNSPVPWLNEGQQIYIFSLFLALTWILNFIAVVRLHTFNFSLNIFPFLFQVHNFSLSIFRTPFRFVNPSPSTTSVNLMCYFLLTFSVMQNFCECNSDFTFAIVMKPRLSITPDVKLY